MRRDGALRVIDRLSLDLLREFPEMKGLSSRNLLYMRAFYRAYVDETIVQQLAAPIPWFHNCVLLDKVKRPEERVWYIRQNITYGGHLQQFLLELGVGFAFVGSQYHLASRQSFHCEFG